MNQKHLDKYIEIRKTAFSQAIALDTELIEIIQEYDSHRFLVNPAGQNVYLYLTLFVKMLSEYHFNRSIAELKILDWGCGKGHVSYFLQRLKARPICCDRVCEDLDSSFGQPTPIIDKNQIAVVELNHEYRLPFESRSLDVVLSFGVLEHVPHDAKSLLEINRVLKPQGLFFCFNLPYKLSWTQNLAHLRGDYYHDRLYSKSQVRQLLQNSGFKIVDLWHRQLLPKNNIRYPQYRLFESIDRFLTEFTPLKYLATNIEFVAIADVD